MLMDDKLQNISSVSPALQHTLLRHYNTERYAGRFLDSTDNQVVDTSSCRFFATHIYLLSPTDVGFLKGCYDADFREEKLTDYQRGSR